MLMALFFSLQMNFLTDTQTYSFAANGESLAWVLNELIQKQSFPLIYSGEPPQFPVSLNCDNCTSAELLTQLLENVTAPWSQVGGNNVIHFDAKSRGLIEGTILLRDRGEPLAGGWVSLALVDSAQADPIRTVTNAAGQFVSPLLPSGVYRLWVQVEGFETIPLGQVTLAAHEKKQDTFHAAMIALPPGEMIVTPGNYQLLASKPAMTHYRTKQDLQRMPHLGNDVLRALAALPGANRDGISARPRSHGGLEGEVQIQLDGMILRDPFHAKELGGAVSSINGETLDGLAWQAGGFTADFGNALGGLMTFESKTPGENGTLVGLSLTDTQVFQKGGFAEGRGHYFVSARSGNLAPLLEMIDFQEDAPTDGDQFNSGYFDSFSKLHYVLNERHSVSTHLHGSHDEVDYGPAFSRGNGSYQDYAFWVNLNSFWNDQWESQTHLSVSDYTDSREGFIQNIFGSLDYTDDRHVRTYRLGQRWRLRKSFLDVRAGWFATDGFTSYDYYHQLMADDVPLFGLLPETETKATYDGNAYEGFLAARFRLHQNLVAEVGGRYDYQTWIKQSQWSPRLNLAWHLAPRTQLKVAAGRFFQPRQLHQLQVEDGQAQFEAPAKAHHYLLGLHHLWQSGLKSRLELFYKPIANPAIRFENLWSPNFFFDQLELDRILVQPDKSAVHGAELSFGWDGNGRISWLGNYTWSQSWDELDGEKFYRRYDQRHTVNLNLNYRLSRLWHGHLAWNYHSGWRTTTVDLERNDEGFELVLGPINGGELPAQHRLDLRFNRQARQDKGFAWHIDIINLYRRGNVRGFDDIFLDENEELVFESSKGLPLLISFGVTWSR